MQFGPSSAQQAERLQPARLEAASKTVATPATVSDLMFMVSPLIVWFRVIIKLRRFR
jgi:hypothetical protein